MRYCHRCNRLVRLLELCRLMDHIKKIGSGVIFFLFSVIFFFTQGGLLNSYSRSAYAESSRAYIYIYQKILMVI
jgi:hypothetical protein